MQASAHSFRRAFPRLKPFRVIVRLLAAAQDFGLDRGMNFAVISRRKNIVFVLVEPLGEPQTFFPRQLH